MIEESNALGEKPNEEEEEDVMELEEGCSNIEVVIDVAVVGVVCSRGGGGNAIGSPLAGII